MAVLALVVIGPGDLDVVAHHAQGGLTTSPQWTLRIVDSQVSVYASDERGSRLFRLGDATREKLITLVNETDFFSLKPRYGLGDIEGHRCSMTISYQGRKNTVTMATYSKRNPPTGAELAEVDRAYRVWDALKGIGDLADLPDDCRREMDIWVIKRK